MKAISFWNKQLRAALPQEQLPEAQAYVKRLIENNVPVILGVHHMAYVMDISLETLKSMINRTDMFYYQFTIPKRSGGERQIAAPYPDLLRAQRWIVDNILSSIPVHEPATAYVRGKSTKDNVLPHIGKKCLLRLDIKDFFPSITINRVISIFRRLGYGKKISYYLASLCCLRDSIPQGAATSPMISNIIAKRLDRRLLGFCRVNHLSYTRYADDFTLSGDEINPRTITKIKSIILSEGFSLNDEKTSLVSGVGRRIVTGISISSGAPKYPKAQKREVRKDVHFVLKNGLIGQLNYMQSSDWLLVERLIGKLLYWKMIEPENPFVNKYLPKMRELSRSF